MRILQVRFKNLNSLVGEWRIDLSSPAYAASGIFAITGPTGAGKTTILDAISLALYGRTPRLSRLNQNMNEIMSRQTGECFAEVTVRTQSGNFRCHWSQRRARGNPGGALQAARHEIADANTGTVLENKLRDVGDRVVAVTGMDFDRFTRSMLLAQGGFAAFLQAPPDDRAPILEQITGTEIYSEISKHVHTLCSDERTKLQALQAELEAMKFLSPEEEQQLVESLDQKRQHDDRLGQATTQKDRAVAWLKGMAKLRGELEALGRKEKEQRARIDEFTAEQTRLDAANCALELEGDFRELKGVREAQTDDRKSLARCTEALPTRTEKAKLAEDAMKAAVALAWRLRKNR